MINKKGPCLDKNCSWCCDPVKIGFPKGVGLNEVLPKKDKNGNDIWEATSEILVPESCPETMMVKIFRCVNYDKDAGQCRDYDNRPDVCRNTSCIDPNSEKSIDEQHKIMVGVNFFKIK
jgi:Fe-S-cluster containining protein